MKVDREQELDLIAGMDRCHATVSNGYREFFSHVVKADKAEMWRADGCRDMGEWLAGRFGTSTWQARRWVAAAHKLDVLPRIAAAFESGQVGVEKVVELTRYATPATEESLVKWARKVKPATIRHQADLATAPSLQDAQEAESSRFLDWWWDLDGMSLAIEGRLPAPEGAQFIKAVDALAKDLPTSPEPEHQGAPVALDYEEALELHVDAEPLPAGDGPEVSLPARRADALALMAAAKLGSCSDVERATVVVHGDLSALGSGNGACSIEGGPIVQAEIARRLICDGRLEVVAQDGEGKTIGINRASREPPAWLRRQVLHRDGGRCTFSGCDMTRFLKTHHIWQWEYEGPTNLDNLVTVCHFHHKLVHEFGWSVKLGDIEGTADWFRPDGSIYEPKPIHRNPATERASSFPELASRSEGRLEDPVPVHEQDRERSKADCR